jgi:hypothetical protein
MISFHWEESEAISHFPFIQVKKNLGYQLYRG